MATAGSVESEPEWRSSVVVRTDATLTAELTARWETASGQRAVGVTDLLALRPAYWKGIAGPVSIDPVHRARLEAGRRLHRELGPLLVPGALLEVRLRRFGIAGRIDALSDRPIELKTSAVAFGGDQLLVERPEHVEQLGMYCALTGIAGGRLVSVRAEGGSGPELRTTDVRFRGTGSIEREMRRRADQLREAWRRADPSELPRCRWFDRGCEIRRAGLCDCTGREGPDAAWIEREVAEVTPRPEEDRRLAPALATAVRTGPSARIPRFRDLVYPRRAYFELRAPLEGEEAEEPPRAPADGTYARLVETIESGTVGDVARIPSRSNEPEEEVPGFRGTPYLARTSRAPSVPGVEEMVTRYPQYALELGFRCAATGTTRARAIVTYERAVDRPGPITVFEFEFAPVTVFSRLWRLRAAGLERALVTGNPRALPPCPAWMFDQCPYRDECACAGGTDRSQR